MAYVYAVLMRTMAPPQNCKCFWTPKTENHGGDVEVNWLLVTPHLKCPVHLWLGSQEYPVAAES